MGGDDKTPEAVEGFLDELILEHLQTRKSKSSLISGNGYQCSVFIVQGNSNSYLGLSSCHCAMWPSFP